MCTVLLPPGVNAIAVNKYIIHHFKFSCFPDESIHVSGFSRGSFVSCSLIMWSRLTLCSATADLSGCASYISIVLFDSDLDLPTSLPNINPAVFTWDAVCHVHPVLSIPIHL